jgi:hypothetical protein
MAVPGRHPIRAWRTVHDGRAMRATLEEHYREHPVVRPTLADLVIAAAELDGHPLAEHPDVLRRAVEQVASRHPDAHPDVVLRCLSSRN